MKVVSINSKELKNTQNLTIEELREFEGLEHLTDEEAEDIVKSLKELSILLFYTVRKMQQQEMENKPELIKFEYKQAA